MSRVLCWFGALAGIVAQAAFAAGWMSRFSSATFATLFFEYLVVMAILWGIVVAIARSKHQKIGNWLGWTFLLGPLALLGLIFVPRAVAPSDLRPCPYCKRQSHRDARICRFCERRLPSVSTAA
jgi:hypothetical protein